MKRDIWNEHNCKTPLVSTERMAHYNKNYVYVEPKDAFGFENGMRFRWNDLNNEGFNQNYTITEVSKPKDAPCVAIISYIPEITPVRTPRMVKAEYVEVVTRMHFEGKDIFILKMKE